jgi:hypothetical protein
MPTLTAPTIDMAEARQQDFERWQAERWRRDEVTDQSERLASPMVNTFEYKLQNGGLVTDLGEPLRPVFEDGFNAAQLQAMRDPKWRFELAQRAIELGELDEIEQFANNMGEGVRMSSVSLDGSDYEGIRAIAEALGHRLPIDRPASTEILANRMWTPEGMVVMSPIPDAVRVDGIDIGAYDKKRQKMIVRVVTAIGDPITEHEALINRVRTVYDGVLTARTGEKHYAGRIQMSNDDAKTFIEKQGDLLDAHMGVIGKIFAATSDHAERNRQAAPHRYNFAAALDDRLHGKDVKSLSDSGDSARSEGKSFDGDCPTSEAAAAGDQADRLGYRVEKWSMGACRNCERTTMIWNERDGGCNVCRDCASAHTVMKQAGLDAERKKAINERAKQERAKAQAKKIGKAAMKAAIITKKSKDEPQYVERLGVGGTVRVLVAPKS